MSVRRAITFGTLPGPIACGGDTFLLLNRTSEHRPGFVSARLLVCRTGILQGHHDAVEFAAQAL